jgi:hypothetical protein
MKMVSSIHAKTMHVLKKVGTHGFYGPGVYTLCNKHIKKDHVDYELRGRRPCKVCWFHPFIVRVPRKIRGLPKLAVMIDDYGFQDIQKKDATNELSLQSRRKRQRH